MTVVVLPTAYILTPDFYLLTFTIYFNGYHPSIWNLLIRTINQGVRLKPSETTLLLGFTHNEPLWTSMDDPPQGNFFVLLTARLTN
jgi:hypothetical protein